MILLKVFGFLLQYVLAGFGLFFGIFVAYCLILGMGGLMKSTKGKEGGEQT